MQPRSRTLFAILFGLPILITAPLALLGARILQEGTLQVHVREKGPEGCCVDVHVPAALVPAVASLTPVCALGGCRIDPEVRRALDVAADALEAMRDAPDGVFVDIRTPRELVRIEKRGGALEVAVDTPEETVRASVPLRAVRSALGFL